MTPDSRTPGRGGACVHQVQSMDPGWRCQLLLVSGFQSFFLLLSDSLFCLLFHAFPKALHLTPLFEIPRVTSALLILLTSETPAEEAIDLGVGVGRRTLRNCPL